MEHLRPGAVGRKGAGRTAARRGGEEHARHKRVLAVAISTAFERASLTVRRAQAETGIAAADFSRIRTGDLGRFSVDRLMSIAARMGLAIELTIRRGARSRRAAAHPSRAQRLPGRRASGHLRTARR